MGTTHAAEDTRALARRPSCTGAGACHRSVTLNEAHWSEAAGGREQTEPMLG